MTAVSGSNRLNRGGSWINNARNCRASNRNNNAPGNRNNNLGFRLLSTRRRQGARFTDRVRVPAPCPGGSSCSGEHPDKQQQPAASGRPECATAVAGNPSIPAQGAIPQTLAAVRLKTIALLATDQAAIRQLIRVRGSSLRHQDARRITPGVAATLLDTDSPPAEPSGRRRNARARSQPEGR